MARLAIILVGLLTACDPCDWLAQQHILRCGEGIVESCQWLAEHAPSGVCLD